MMKNIRLRRLLALYIDFALAVIVSTMITKIITLGHVTIDSSPIILCISMLINTTLLFYFIICKDLAFKNASVGKKLFGLHICYTNGDIPDRKIIMKRISTCILLFPLDIILIIFKNQTSGDEEYHTQVVNKTHKKKNFVLKREK